MKPVTIQRFVERTTKTKAWEKLKDDFSIKTPLHVIYNAVHEAHLEAKFPQHVVKHRKTESYFSHLIQLVSGHTLKEITGVKKVKKVEETTHDHTIENLLTLPKPTAKRFVPPPGTIETHPYLVTLLKQLPLENYEKYSFFNWK
jgi:hypothetical protein